LAAGLLASPAVAETDSIPAEPISRMDPRWILVKQFFLENNSPAHVYTGDFLIAADTNGLDWRLLPSLSIVESGGGKDPRNNNIFGWANGKQRFHSMRESIYQVAFKLKNSVFFRGKTSLDQILWTYNPQHEYTVKVRRLMARLGPAHLAVAGAQ